MSDRALRAEIDSLRSSLEALRIEVRELGDRVIELEGGGGYLPSSPPRAPSGAAASAKAASISNSHYSVLSGSPSSNRSLVGVEDTEARAQLAREIGDFIRRALEGNFRGSSGRDRLRLASRLYLVFADFHGNRLSPPRVIRNFAEVSSLCKQGPDAGQSVFIGVPSQWEARIVFSQAGFDWSASA